MEEQVHVPSIGTVADAVAPFPESASPDPVIPPPVPVQLLVVPIRDRVIVRRIKVGDKRTEAGLYIPDKAREQPYQGVVVAVGDGRVMPNGQVVPMSVALGDEVLFGKFNGTEIKVNGEEYLMLREDEVIGALRPPTDELKKQSNLEVAKDVDGTIENRAGAPAEEDESHVPQSPYVQDASSEDVPFDDGGPDSDEDASAEDEVPAVGV